LNIYMRLKKSDETFAHNPKDGRYGKERAMFRWPKYMAK
jgi:hypothetical protein